MDAAFPSPEDAAKQASKPKKPFLRKKSGFISSALKKKPSNKARVAQVTPDKSSSEGTQSPPAYDTRVVVDPPHSQSFEVGGDRGVGVGSLSPAMDESADDFEAMEKMLGIGDDDDASSQELAGDSDLIPSSSLPPPSIPAAATAKFVPPQLRMRQDAPKLPCEATPPKEAHAPDGYEDDWGYDDEIHGEGNVVVSFDCADRVNDYDGCGVDEDGGVEYEDQYYEEEGRGDVNYARSSYSGRHSSSHNPPSNR
jgi:hypothetical protein